MVSTDIAVFLLSFFVIEFYDGIVLNLNFETCVPALQIQW